MSPTDKQFLGLVHYSLGPVAQDGTGRGFLCLKQGVSRRLCSDQLFHFTWVKPKQTFSQIGSMGLV